MKIIKYLATGEVISKKEIKFSVDQQQNILNTEEVKMDEDSDVQALITSKALEIKQFNLDQTLLVASLYSPGSIVNVSQKKLVL